MPDLMPQPKRNMRVENRERNSIWRHVMHYIYWGWLTLMLVVSTALGLFVGYSIFFGGE